MTAPTVRQAKILRMMELMQILLISPKTVEEIAEFMDIHVRNAYRYLRLIDQLGIQVRIRKRQTVAKNHKFKHMYYIEQCPCCGQKKVNITEKI